jgi:hypothetical protein
MPVKSARRTNAARRDRVFTQGCCQKLRGSLKESVDQTIGQLSILYAALSDGWERQSAIADKACPAGDDTRAVFVHPDIVMIEKVGYRQELRRALASANMVF